MKISVVMASYLGEYPNCAKNREQKFIRAVESFLAQSWPDKELLIIADGCADSSRIFEERFARFRPLIRCLEVPKQALYSGNIRTLGLQQAQGDLITYLDSDDLIGNDHLKKIVSRFPDDADFVYYDDMLVTQNSLDDLHRREVRMEYGYIGTSAISHRNLHRPPLKQLGLRWGDGYGHDWRFISSLLQAGLRTQKIDMPEYVVCHWGLPGNTLTGDF